MNTIPGAAIGACPRCDEGLPSGARFCSRCGLDLVHESAGLPPAPVFVPRTPGPNVAQGPPAWVPGPGTEPAGGTPSAVGRRATRAGWFGAIAVAGLFLAASIALLAMAGVFPVDTTPLARWDPTLGDPARIEAGVPFAIEVEARNPGTPATDPVWVVIAWRPPDLSFTPGASGRFFDCTPSPCTHRDDPAAGVTEVGWPGLVAGDRQAYVVTVSVTGIEPGDTLVYRVTTGTGADAAAVRGGLTWTLELGVD